MIAPRHLDLGQSPQVALEFALLVAQRLDRIEMGGFSCRSVAKKISSAAAHMNSPAISVAEMDVRQLKARAMPAEKGRSWRFRQCWHLTQIKPGRPKSDVFF